MEQDIKEFYEIAFRAIEKEDLELRRLFTKSENNKMLYGNEHNGICCLYETTFVYAIFKALMENDFKYRVVWECPYPTDSKLHSDIGLEDNNGNIVALIEFKIWQQEDCKLITSDIDKLKNEKTINDKYIFVIEYGGELEENKEYLINQNKNNIKLINEPKSMESQYYSAKERKIIDNNINIFMFKVL